MIGALFLVAAEAQSRIPVEVQPKGMQGFPIELQPGQVAEMVLHLDGGLVSVRAVGPEGQQRAALRLDLGRGARIPYVVGDGTPGMFRLEIQSLETTQPARCTLEIGAPTSSTPSLLNLRNAEDALAGAELIRRGRKADPASDALPGYAAALRLAQAAGDVPLQRLVLTQKARYLIFRKSQFQSARQALEQAIALEDHQDTAQQALAWKTMSTVLYDLGSYVAAIDAGRRSLALYRVTGDVYWQGIVLGNLSADYAEMGESAEALAAGREALQDSEQVKDSAGVVFSLSQLAGIYQRQGDFESAFQTFRQGLNWVQSIKYAPLVEAEIRNDMGLFFAELGDWPQAKEALERCLELSGNNDDPVTLEAHGVLSLVQEHSGQRKAALASDTAAIASARKLSLKREEAQILLRRASLEIKAKQQADAESDIALARTLASSLGAPTLSVAAELAWGNARLPLHPEQAGDSFRRAEASAELLGEREEQSAALAGLARAQQAEGNLAGAAASIESALTLVEHSRGSLKSRDLQVSYFAEHRRWYELAVDIAMQRDRVDPQCGYSRQAFRYTERAHARSLLDTLESTEADPNPELPEGLRERLARNRQVITEQQQKLEGAGASETRPIAEALQRAYREQDALLAEVRSSKPGKTPLSVGEPVEVSALQHQLMDAHSILLSYWVGESHSYRWVLTRERVDVKELPRREKLDAMLQPLIAGLHGRRPQPLAGEALPEFLSRSKSYAQRLDAELAQAGALLLPQLPPSTKTLLVVSDPDLESLPFTALRVQAPGGRTEYVIQRYSVLQEPSAAVALSLKQRPALERPLSVAVFADPVFSQSDPRLLRHEHFAEAPGLRLVDLPRLKSTGQEARSIAKLDPAAVEVWTGWQATPERARAAAGNASILHFATHTIHLADRSQLSGIALSMVSEQGKPADGVLWLEEIAATPMAASMVVLSACDTNRSDNRVDEGLDRLSYAFFYSGARSVLGTLWDVEDSASGGLMQRFYAGLIAKGLRSDEALRSAQLHLLADAHTRSPVLWAPFVLMGWPQSYRMAPSAKRSSAGTPVPPAQMQ